VAIHEAGHCAAAIPFSIPVISVTIVGDRPHLRRGRYRPACPIAGLHRLVTLCLSGPEAERVFCGPITDGGDTADRRMAGPSTFGRENTIRLTDSYNQVVLLRERDCPRAIEQSRTL
jgi:hypothetical protein